MKKSLYGKSLIAAVLCFVAASCSKQNDLVPATASSEATVKAGQKSLLTTTHTITFEGIGRSYMADTTSYGDNAYSTWGGTQIAPYVHTPSKLRFAVKGAGGATKVDYWNGGFVVSDWNYKANTPGKTGDWWYSYLNQCSVYSGTSGAKNGGYGGSNNFAVLFGYVDSYNSSYTTRPVMNFTSGSGVVDGMYVCLSSYTYGVIQNGNTFGSTGVATPLKDIAGGKGYFKLLAYGYNGNTPTNGGNPVEIDLARYNNHTAVAGPLTTWTYFDLSDLGTVTRVEFNFEGNDSGAYGLNTPAYVCIDNVKVTL
ncbi:DUF4465 domain-containing protein [Chitinophaga nivalis]|uniref:DUF4465 domain-containing protein n=1 Tax=Chitinophaga nivalis TaxID=2991709 RepID=A0ABT3IPD1_9BACT|nr:DUF4465 domain-containing protein [Chitinophaga nivalis]MCW3464477.1 DUF4465 domain-containing protein [Chitinophaga nivalis]MCW3485832.1 DUF4465 domain-containing protein [Chitinophaga nivalis]